MTNPENKRRLGRGLDSLLGRRQNPDQQQFVAPAASSLSPSPPTSTSFPQGLSNPVAKNRPPKPASSPHGAANIPQAYRTASQIQASKRTTLETAKAAVKAEEGRRASRADGPAIEAGNVAAAPVAGGDVGAGVAVEISKHNGYISDVPIELISPNPFQPRQDFDEAALEEMMRSIQTSGLLQPLAVRPHGPGYQLIAGERRLRACLALGKLTVPIVIRDVSDDRMLELALVENLQRQDLNPIEKAEAFQGFLTRLKLTQQEAAARLGVDRASFANILRLLDLAPPVQQLVREGVLGMSHARTLASLPGAESQMRLATRAVHEGLSVRSLERAVQAILRAEDSRHSADAKAGGGAGGAAAGGSSGELQVGRLQEELGRLLGTKVRIQQSKRKGMGRIMIEYYNFDDFDRILSRLR